MELSFAERSLPDSGALVVGIREGGELTPTAAQVDERLGGAVRRAVEASRFSGKPRQFLDLVAPVGLSVDRVVLAGLGKSLDDRGAEDLGGAVYNHLAGSGHKAAAVAVDGGEGATGLAARIALGVRLAAYRFDKYRTKEKPEDKPSLARVTVLVDGAEAAAGLFGPLDKVAEGVVLARNLVSEPPNVVYPETLAAEAEALRALGVEVEVFGHERMLELGMGALIGVAQGSEREAKVAIMQWKGGAEGGAPLAVVGKGVTFDSGGISLKPGAGMEDMKYDMAGSAAVIGLMKALAGRKAKANVIGAVGLTENMPSGGAQRPGDIVRSMSGQTIEIINTDAEGRLVLADVIWYVQDRFKPSAIIDLATLTGAIIVGLGHHHAGLYATEDRLADNLLAAGKAVGETLWRMPLGDEYDQQIRSDVADMKNTGGRDGGSITGAQFIKRFTNDVPWAHLDIAGVAWTTRAKPTVPKGGSGFGVRLLDRLVADYYEKA